MIELYIQLFNITFDSGTFQDIWLIDHFIPIYKNKDFKLFSEQLTLNENQGSFKKNYSTINNRFVLNTILSLIKAKQKKIYIVYS